LTILYTANLWGGFRGSKGAMPPKDVEVAF